MNEEEESSVDVWLKLIAVIYCEERMAFLWRVIWLQGYYSER